MSIVLENPLAITGGVRLDDNSDLSFERHLTKAGIPEFITIPLSQFDRSTVRAVISVGDKVLKGQCIAKDAVNNRVPVFASTSGTVKEFIKSTHPDFSGEQIDSIIIETDQEDNGYKSIGSISDYKNLSAVELRKVIHDAGISLNNINNKKIKESNLLIINAAESEPYISCNEALIRCYASELIYGIRILAYALEIDHCIIAIDEDKSDAISIIKESLSEIDDRNIEVKLISGIYPASEEKQLIKSITGMDISFEACSLEKGIIVENISTAYAVKKAIVDGVPYISRVVTITGPGINQPCNLEVLIGTPVKELIKHCGGFNEQFKYLIVGGPMKGFRLDDINSPVTNSTECLLATDDTFLSDNVEHKECIRCDDCVPVCPVNLQPQQLHWHALEGNDTQLNNMRLFDCIECGCCSYVCPSYIPLVAEYKQAKSNIRNQQYKKNKAAQNKKRYLDKLARKIREEEEKEKQRLKKSTNNKDDDLQNKKKIIADAVDRVRKKRSEK